MRSLSTLSLLALLLSALPAEADSRYSCMASDDRLKMAVRLEFSGVLGGKLAHISGVLSATGKDLPAYFGKLKLTSDMITQQWVDGKSIRMRLIDDSDTEKPVYMALGAQVTDANAGRLHGTYVLEGMNGKEPGFRMEGALFCQIDQLADVALPDPL